MRIELVVIIITGLLMYNTYYDNKYLDWIKGNIKLLKVGLYGLIGLSILIFLRKYPNQSTSLISHANDFIKYMPIEKGSKDLITPLFNFTQNSMMNNQIPHQEKRMLNSGLINNVNAQSSNINNVKRSVSESKKKYVASRQSWACAHCKSPLDYTFEVDHVIELQHGGSNHVDNLEALCRNCHGKKTFKSKL